MCFFFVLFLLSNSSCHLIHEWGIRLSIVKFSLEYFFISIIIGKYEHFMRKHMLILYCDIVTLNATHTHFTNIIKIISKGKKEGKITRENGLFYNQRLSLLTEWTILRGFVYTSYIVTQDKQKRTFVHLGFFAQRDA